ncbi:hypothetical protein PI125_g2468 [Phytophthora idaei]|nr:hypothetical protein PI125_g2468 [Phytophthora idaei]
MPGRFFGISEHLDADDEAIEDLLPSPSSTKKLKALLVKMKMVESVSKRIQSSDVTIWEVRALFDALLQQFPVFAKYLGKWNCLFTLARSVELPFLFVFRLIRHHCGRPLLQECGCEVAAWASAGPSGEDRSKCTESSEWRTKR